jgi:ABC-type transporter Mla MlaB component
MELKREGERLTLYLSNSATIFSIEEDFLKINDELVSNNLKFIEINTSQLEEIDTAYLQLILSIINTTDGIFDLEITGDSESFSEILDLYGIKLGG